MRMPQNSGSGVSARLPNILNKGLMLLHLLGVGRFTFGMKRVQVLSACRNSASHELLLVPHRCFSFRPQSRRIRSLHCPMMCEHGFELPDVRGTGETIGMRHSCGKHSISMAPTYLDRTMITQGVSLLRSKRHGWRFKGHGEVNKVTRFSK